MRRIRKVDTTPERVVRRIAHALGRRFRLHQKGLLGTPDLVFRRDRKAILVHGCFWHQHEGCRLARLPKTRLGYWLPKLARNKARDAETQAALEKDGWRCMIVWECETRSEQDLRTRVADFLIGDGDAGDPRAQPQ